MFIINFLKKFISFFINNVLILGKTKFIFYMEVIFMINDDTIKLLKECNAGIKMGVSSLTDVMDHVKNDNFKKVLLTCKEEHEHLGNETHKLLNEYHDSGKEPNPMAKSMSFIKTNFQLAVNDSDKTIADLITDGCNMGVKSLSRYLNQYKAAEEKVKNITKNLIKSEEQLVINIREYL